jgi:ferredoxin
MADTSPPQSLVQSDDQGNKYVQIGRYRIHVLRDKCIAAASCLAISPEVFELDEMQKAIIKNDGHDSPENILMAAQACPTKAIVIVDSETGKQLWPQE